MTDESHAYVYDADNIGHVKTKKDKVRFETERNEAELREIVETPGGAYFFWRILSECGLYQEGPNDAYHLAIHEGKRRVGNWLLTELTNIDEQLYTKVRMIGSKREGEIK